MVPLWDYEVTLDFWPLKRGGGSTDTPESPDRPVSSNDAPEYRAVSGSYYGFYFEASGTAKEIYLELSLQVSMYQSFFPDDEIRFQFHTYDLDLAMVTGRLNADQNIEGYKHEDYDW